MPIETLTELQYSQDRKGPFALYVFREDGLHSGKQWFENTPRYPDEQITTAEAMGRTARAMAAGLEVRITDGGDMLVYHAHGSKVLYGENFWDEAIGKPVSNSENSKPQTT